MIRDRAAGAILGALIGDALALGCHWYYDLAEMRRRHGEWISGYLTPRDDWYHAGMKAGQSSQTALITIMLLRSVLQHGDYVESDFTHRLEAELFPLLDGTAMKGPGGYTNQSIREAYLRRVVQKKPWTEIAGQIENTEAAERAIVLAVRYAKNPRTAAATAASNCRLTHANEMIVALSTSFDCVVSLLVAGEKLDATLSTKLMDLVGKGDLPFKIVHCRRNRGRLTSILLEFSQFPILFSFLRASRGWSMSQEFKSSLLGKHRLFSACPAPSTISFLPSII